MAFPATGKARRICYTKPGRNKTRGWTARAVGRVACYARNNGVTAEELLDELSECAPCKGKRRNAREDAKVASALQLANGIMQDSEIILTGIQVGIEGLLLLSRFVPMLKSVAIPAQLAIKPVAGLVRRIKAGRAANDEAFEIVTRRDAA